MIGVVILNYNNWDDTFQCINSLLMSKQLNEYRIYLIDNRSTIKITDNMRNLVDNNKDIINFVINDKNAGYAAGNNIGIKMALVDGCDYLLVSNNDILFNNAVLDELVDGFLIDPEIGITAPVLLDDNLKPRYISMLKETNYSVKVFHRTFIRLFLSKKKRETYRLDPPFLKQFYYVHAASGAFFMMSKECAKSITPFDENTFLYEEELIIGKCMEHLGYKTIVLPNIRVLHIGGKSTETVSVFSFTESVKSEIYYLIIYLKANKIQVNFLYMIRFFSYISRCLKYKDFRKNFVNFVKETRRHNKKWRRIIKNDRMKNRKEKIK